RRAARPDRPMPRAVLIVGAGPAGLATAACLKRRGLQADLVDRHGVAGGAYHRIYPGVTLASPARYTALPGLKPQAAGEYISVPQYRDYLGNYAAHHGLSVRKASVTRVRRESGRFHAWFKAEPQRAYDAVVVATGMFDFPRRLDGAMHASEWHGPAALAGPRGLVIGGAAGADEDAGGGARAGRPPPPRRRPQRQRPPARRL